MLARPTIVIALSALTMYASVSAQTPQTPRTAAAAAAPTTTVPVRKVVLFSSGVGYFEHAGTVHGDGSAELRFTANQINDVLKSLVLQDQDGGRVSAITYASQDPISKTLRSFQVDITSNPSLAQLLNQLRGAKVTVEAQADHITGTILGVETRRVPVDKGDPVDVSTLNLLIGGTIRTVQLPAITSLTLDDPQLQDELTKALAALSQARDQDKKPVTVSFNGTGDRRVRIGYVVETPVWKTSYRLLLGDKGAALQGWAIIENQTESDWNDVSLSLVSGRPISFVMDLYQPLYANRPTVVPEQYAGLSPQMYEGGFTGTGAPAAAAVGAGGGGGGGRGGRGGGAGGGGVSAQAPRAAGGVTSEDMPVPMAQSKGQLMLNATTSVQAQGTAGDLGELFEFSVGNVTLPRQKSAMLPIITDSIGVERVSIYNSAVLPKNPLTGVRLTNTTGKLLLQGPMTVLDQNSYAGDARIDNVPQGQQRLLSYGIDLQMLVDDTKNTWTNAITTGRLVKGVLTVDRKLVASQEYRADNKSDKSKVLVIEHPIRQGWKLVDTPKAIETTPTLYRFQTAIPAKTVTSFTVTEERVQSEDMSLLTSDAGALIVYSRTGEIPSGVRDAIAKAIQLKQALADLGAQITQRASKIGDITTEQNRIREDMKAVGQTTAYYERLLTKLNDQETAIEQLQKERSQLQDTQAAQQKAFEDYLSGLTVG